MDNQLLDLTTFLTSDVELSATDGRPRIGSNTQFLLQEFHAFFFWEIGFLLQAA